MKKALILTAVLLAATIYSGADALLDKIDDMHDEEQFDACVALINSELSGASGPARAELLWRLARATLEIGDDLENAGESEDAVLAKFEEGERYADEAIESDPDNHLGYYWKSANIGRWGQVKGILNSLAKAKPMRNLLMEALEINPWHGDSYNVLGMLYEQVPGRPLSFGNADYAVSIGRMAIDANAKELEDGTVDEVKYAYYMELAHHLWARNWNEGKRIREQNKKKDSYDSAKTSVEKAFLYEGKVSIPNASDREEAVEVMEWFVSQLEALPTLDSGQQEDLAEGKADLESWK